MRSISHDLIIDGLKRFFCFFSFLKSSSPLPGSGGASFANDGRDATKNNAKFRLVYLEKGPLPPTTGDFSLTRCILEASRDIAPHAEILVSYGTKYWLWRRGTEKRWTSTHHMLFCTLFLLILCIF
jgi:hypothetical protein